MNPALILVPGRLARDGEGSQVWPLLRTIKRTLEKLGYDYEHRTMEPTTTLVNQAFVDQYEFIIVPTMSTTGSIWTGGSLGLNGVLNGTLNCTTLIYGFNNATPNAALGALTGTADAESAADYYRYQWRGINLDLYGRHRQVRAGYEAFVTPLVTLKSDATQMFSWKCTHAAGPVAGVGVRYISMPPVLGAVTNAFPMLLQDAIDAGDIPAPPKKLRSYWDLDHFPNDDMTLAEGQIVVAQMEQYGLKYHFGFEPGVGVGADNSFENYQAGVLAYCKTIGNVQWCVHNHDWYWDGKDGSNNVWTKVDNKREKDSMYRADIKRAIRNGYPMGPAEAPYSCWGYMHLPNNRYGLDMFTLASCYGSAETNLHTDPNNLPIRRFGYGIKAIRLVSKPSGSIVDNIPVFGTQKKNTGDAYSYGVKHIIAQTLEVAPYSDNQTADSATEIQVFAVANRNWLTDSCIFGDHCYTHVTGHIVRSGTHTGPWLRYMAQVGALAAHMKDVHEFALEKDNWYPPADGYMNPFLPDDALTNTAFWLDFADMTTTWQATTRPTGTWSGDGNAVAMVENQLYHLGRPDTTQTTGAKQPVVAVIESPTGRFKRCLAFTSANDHYLSAPASAFHPSGDWSVMAYIRTTTGANQVILGQYLDANNYWHLQYLHSSGNLSLDMRVAGVNPLPGGIALPLTWGDIDAGGLWALAHVEFDVTNGRIRTYKDNVLTDTDTFALPATFDNGGTFYFGTHKDAGGASWNGHIQQVLLDNQIFSTAERGDLYTYLTTQ